MLDAHDQALRIVAHHLGEPDPIACGDVNDMFRWIHRNDARYILAHSWRVSIRLLIEIFRRNERRLSTHRTDRRLADWIAEPGMDRSIGTGA